MRLPTALILLVRITVSVAQASPDGSIVPFTSSLPVCASKCGPLFDVQGKCTPPVTAGVDKECFCSDPRMESLKTGPISVSSICGPQSCTSDADLRMIRSWLLSYCGSPSSISDDGDSISTGNNSQTKSWISGHYKWVIMLIIIFTIIFGAWILACVLRKRYLRKKESEAETAAPVAWGPHQMQGATGGYSNNVSMIEKIYAVPNVSNSTTVPGESATATHTISADTTAVDISTTEDDKLGSK